MKSYPSTSITRLSGDIMADASREPVMITKYRKPGYVIMAADQYMSLVGQAPSEPGSLNIKIRDEKMSKSESRDVYEDHITLQLFADRLIDREEAEERTGLYLSEILILMGRLGIKRKAVGAYEGMTNDQKRLFDEVFSA